VAWRAAPSRLVPFEEFGEFRAAPGSHDWPAYLDGPLHTSYSRSQTVITAATAKDLVPDRSRL
jgi:hypothetical protein